MSLKVLVIEDDVVFCRLLTKYLNNNQILTKDAQSAAQAREILAAEQFDFIITDYKLPDQDGLSVLEGIKDGPNKNAKTLLMSRFKEDDMVSRARELGVLDFVQKPIKPNELLVLLEKLK
ncbi:Response regulator receiver domain-containing protein [Sinomicrobium oceani]|uniref:Response regulator receiver domain-containing protein n=1 Tax=Sinomicrobium oceani TaxID=1150368 RepID=A0A1K1Q2I4_9FLAO|nr:response regulator [Sinomicrobium oceani]SFW53937.1 Response regulator receiver domain-containing protein [Sinomicrobium oceani]